MEHADILELNTIIEALRREKEALTLEKVGLHADQCSTRLVRLQTGDVFLRLHRPICNSD